MDPEQSIELLNATHDFPCAYTLKEIGLTADGFIYERIRAVDGVVMTM